jgi:hydrogenase-4 component E
METFEYTLAGLVLLITYWLLIARRIRGAINGYAFQSVVIGVIVLATYAQSLRLHLLVLALSTFLIKGILIPIVLRRQVRATVYDKRETHYYVGFPTALLIGMGLSIAGFVAANRLDVVKDLVGQPVLGVAVAVVLIGFFITVARQDAVMQLTGLLVAENGLLLLGLVMSAGLGLLVDFALLMDVLVGAVVMGFLIARMNATIMSTDTGELTRLRG